MKSTLHATPSTFRRKIDGEKGLETQPGRLLYLVGPSGAGKDSILDHARGHLPVDAPVRIAQRWITRPASPDGEQHRPVSPQEFEHMLAAGRFAMAWRAHGRAYGIDVDIRDWLARGLTVVVSGSREYLPQALQDFPRLQVVSVVVSPALLQGRLERRAREVPVEIERRLKRATQFTLPAGVPVVEIRNDADPDIAGRELLQIMLADSQALKPSSASARDLP
jgi:ribose 1,5-bisphosphokinase